VRESNVDRHRYHATAPPHELIRALPFCLRHRRPCFFV
jgi:hypothetical protein